jgi:ankyrin repeat protein
LRNKELVKFSIESGANVRARNKTDLEIFSSAVSRNEELVSFLMDTYGFRGHRKSKFRDTPLEGVALRGHVSLAKLLLQREAKANSGHPLYKAATITPISPQWHKSRLPSTNPIPKHFPRFLTLLSTF